MDGRNITGDALDIRMTATPAGVEEAGPRGPAPATALPRPLRIAFLARHVGYLRNFDSVLALLARRGHEVHVVFHIDDAAAQGEKILIEELAPAHPTIRFHQAPALPRDRWWALTKIMRASIDYIRFLDPRYDDARILRTRSEKRTPNFLLALSRHLGKRPWLIRPVFAALKRLEREIPTHPGIQTFLASLRPDVVLFTPLIDLGSQQLDYLVTARAMRLRTVLCVMSWDHLSSKSVIRVLPDIVTVWNATQKTEAIELHGVPAERIVITGAQCFDSWFDRAPSTSRDEFCGKVGLDASRPFILYVCSSLMRGTAPESGFLPRWIGQIRSHSHPVLREAGILVRPHPKRSAEWAEADLTRFGNVSVWPHAKAFPVGSQARRDYFDSMYHSAAIVGINTSALIEGGIVGRPVHSILLPEFRDNQQGTLHFHYLLSRESGLLNVATTFEEHLGQLARSLTDGAGSRERNERFVGVFVRPRGLQVAATPVFCDTIERLAGTPPAPPEAPLRWGWLLRHLLLLASVGAPVITRGIRRTTAAKVLQRKVERRGLVYGLLLFSLKSLRALGRRGAAVVVRRIEANTHRRMAR